ncbi:hypothetical protein RBB50_001573 [Rhinocladiella similis]
MARTIQENERLILELTRGSTSSGERTSKAAFIEEARASPVTGEIPPTQIPATTTPTPSTPPVADPEPIVAASGALPGAQISDLSIDEHGQLCYHGPTSAVHDPSLMEGRSASVAHEETPQSDADVRRFLRTRASESRSLEDFSVGTAALQIDIPKEVVSKMLQLHWAWIAPMFLWVYRPAFMRDMATGGQYCSQLLVTVLCAHSSRFQGGELGRMLISRARLLLGSEIQKPSSIPTAQALLQLSARELAYGATSQAWLYSGMAFRMVSDLGLHHSSGRGSNLSHLTAEDLEIRKRLFWSCYFWDKAISLYLGRMPTLTDLPPDHTPVLFDDFAEHELWVPYYGDAGHFGSIPAHSYPQKKAHSITCFENSCKLAIIINDIMVQLYSRRPSSNTEQTLSMLQRRLDYWRAASPSHLKCDPNDAPLVCPPPHIVAQNLLYYSTIILLHRPFNSTLAHHQACRQASNNIESLLLVLEKTFGFTRLTYLMAYCVYTGASAIVKDVRDGDVEATSRMATFQRALQGALSTCPLVQRSLDIINNGLQTADRHQSRPLNSSIQAEAQEYLPAFPNHDLLPDLDQWESRGSIDLNSFPFLDCFPENHIDIDTGDWYLQT